jgi:hypothetical protein
MGNILIQCDEGSNQQVSHLSWWPKHSTWQKSLFNVGHWTPATEDWFQKRLELIWQNKAPCRTAGKWYESIPRHGRSLRLAQKLDVAAGQFIEGKIFL